MRNFYLRAMLAIAALGTTGCVDDKYDLSDIDTTAEFKVQDLVLPVNLDEIKLKDVLSLDDKSNLKIIDGEYVFTDDGSFVSAPVVVDPIDIEAPNIDALHERIEASSTGEVYKYPIASGWTSFEYRTSGVSEYILDITKIATRLKMSIDISVDELSGTSKSITVTDLRIKLPVGLTMSPSHGGTYNPKDGILTVPSATSSTGKLTITADVTSISVPSEAAQFVPASHLFTFDDRMRIVGGTLSLRRSDYPGVALGSPMNMSVKFSFSSLHAEKFSGRLYYTFAGFDINPINLSNLPDFLKQPDTNITLQNPQIYLTLNNPVGPSKLDAYAGLALTPVRNNIAETPLTLDNGTFVIPHSAGKGPYSFCLSPAKPNVFASGFGNATHVPFTSLREILTGKGLPNKINVEINDAGVPPSDVTDFVLGSLGSVEGKYKFYAPLALGANSVIRYCDTEDGWNDDTVDKITIKKLEIHALATNDTPFDVNLSGYPIAVGGGRIDNVEVVGADLEKGANKKPITIYITGPVTHLDGITFTAALLSPDNTGTLTPNNGITLSDIRVTVSGSYVDKL